MPAPSSTDKLLKSIDKRMANIEKLFEAFMKAYTRISDSMGHEVRAIKEAVSPVTADSTDSTTTEAENSQN